MGSLALTALGASLQALFSGSSPPHLQAPLSGAVLTLPAVESTTTAATREPSGRTGVSSTVDAEHRVASALDPLDRDEPLSPEDVALIDALDATSTATTSTLAGSRRVEGGPRYWLAPAPLALTTLALPGGRIRETGARSLAEAFEAHTTVVDTARRFVAGDSALVRGQSGHRVALSVDGVPLHHALTPSRGTPGWSTLDPWMIEDAVLERPGSIELSPRGVGGSIRLTALAPRAHPGLDVEAETTARSADRSTAARVSAGVAQGIAGARIALGYSDFRALRVATSSVSQERLGAYRRANVLARARLFGRPEDPLTIHAGIDFDRLADVPRTDLALEPRAIDRENERFLAFTRADLAWEPVRASILLARQAFTRGIGDEADREAAREERALSYFGRAWVEYRLIEALILRAGTLAEASNAQARVDEDLGDLGYTRFLEGFLSAELALERLNASATVAFVDAKTRATSGVSVSAARPLAQAFGRLTIAGPLGLRAGMTQALYLPTVQDLRDARDGRLDPELSLSFETGPSLYGRSGWLEVLGFYTLVENAIEPQTLLSSVLVGLEDVRLLGVEITGGLLLLDRVRLTGSMTWTDGEDRVSGAPVVTFPSVTTRASLRYMLPSRGMFIEAHARHASQPVHLVSLRGATPPASLEGLAPVSFLTLGLAGGTDLGLGLHLSVSVENVLDTPSRAPLSLVPGAGVDVRASLGWSLP